MEKKLYYIQSGESNPYRNIALEEHLLLHVPKDAVILYLWQNDRTVVIGRNQCAWRECNVAQLVAEGGRLARRLSGGGAVYHDMGNLNFTFLYPQEQEDILKQTGVIQRAVATYGLNPEISGRNDITVEGKKFSGNAYYKQGGRAYHHGTLLIQTDTSPLVRYLNVHEDKYKSKGVQSVKSRVVNLASLNPDIEVEGMKKRLLAAFEAVYQGKAESVPAAWLDENMLTKGEERFGSWDWVYGRPVACTFSGEKRYAFGLLRLELEVKGGRVVDCGIFTDAMTIDVFKPLQEGLLRQTFDYERMASVVRRLLSNVDAAYAQAFLDLLATAF